MVDRRPIAVLTDALRQAAEQSRLAYEFSPTSYTYGAMSACASARNALDVCLAAMERGDEPGASLILEVEVTA